MQHTWEVSHNQPLHPDPTVVARMHEAGFSTTCEFGCKVYADPLSNALVLAHNSAYGCHK